MSATWYRGLFKVGSVTDIKSIVLRVALAVGTPLIICELINRPAVAFLGAGTALLVTLNDAGESRTVRLITMLAAWIAICLGGVAGRLFGYTPYGREIVVLLCALVAGRTSSSHPSVVGVTRTLAIAATAATGLPFGDPDISFGVAAGGISTLGSAVVTWKFFGIPATENVTDWRANARLVFLGREQSARFALCYSTAAAIALFASSWLGVQHPFSAAFVVLSVMRREGTASLMLTVQYALGTLLGVIFADLIRPFVNGTPILVVLVTFVAAFYRVGFGINPALGYMALTMFTLLGIRLVTGVPPNLLEARVYDVTVGCTLALLGTLAVTYPGYPRREVPVDPQEPQKGWTQQR